MRIDRRGMMGGGLMLAAAGVPLGRATGAARGPVSNRIMVEDGRVFIAAKIGAKGPFIFVVDTGADRCLIEDSFAKSLGLDKRPGQQAWGIGGVSDYSWYMAGDVTLASGIRFPDMLFAGIGFRPSKDSVGAFGAGMFTTYDSDLDFVKGEWRAYPDGRPNFDGLVKVPSRFTQSMAGQKVLAKASIEDFEGEFLLDTGMPGEVMLSGRAAKNSGLWNDARPYSPGRARGVGKGEVPTRIVRAARLKIGPFVFENPLVTLSEPGTPAATQQDGIIGLKALSQLHLTTQVSKGALWAAPNNLWVRPARTTFSGVWLDEKKGRVVVDDVGTGSPAAAAGLKKGDVLVAANLSAGIRLISGPPGKEVVLTVERGGVRQDIRYTLTPYL